MDIKKMTFKEIADEFNATLKNTAAADSTEPSSIKEELFRELKRKYPQLKMRNVDINCNRFSFGFEYANDYKGIKEYDRGSVTLEFSIKSKKTDTLEKISATRSKYVHTKHDKPVAFAGFHISPSTMSFEWKNEDPTDISLISGGRYFSSGTYGKDKKKTVEEILSEVPESYEKEFTTSVVQPYLKMLIWNGRKRNTLYDALPSELQEKIDKKQDGIFEEMADFIVDNGLIS